MLRQGRFWIEAASIWVPEQMVEYYRETRSVDEIMATATYSVVRRLQVSASEKIGKPPGL